VQIENIAHGRQHMVDKTLTPSEVKWRYLSISWELGDFLPPIGTKIRIRIGNETIQANINKRRRIRAAKLFEILKPEKDDILSIVRKEHDIYEISLK